MLNLFFPKLCRGCDNELLANEIEICTFCRHQLPLTAFHQNGSDELQKIFYGRVPVLNATTLLYFQKNGLTQKFVHALKYKGAVNIGNEFGKWLGEELKLIDSYKTIEAVVPVPLHKKKLRQRGYNQVEGFGKEIAKALSVDYIDDVLIKITPTISQVFKERVSRIFSQQEVFTTQNEQKIKGKHLLVVDDIITSGATLESCASKLLRTEGVKLSFAAIAITK
jgi:ComF family protein